MLEDKLTHDERVRLECIAQANLLTARFAINNVKNSADKVIEAAREFEAYVKGDSNE